MSTVDRSFIGAGGIYFQPYDKSAPLLPLGNVSEFNFSFEEDRKELKNYLCSLQNWKISDLLQ